MCQYVYQLPREKQDEIRKLFTDYGFSEEDVENAMDSKVDDINHLYRKCDECGKFMGDGFIENGGDWYCCSDCMKKLIDQNEIRYSNECGCENEVGGYYDRINDWGEWQASEIFWTQWMEVPAYD